MQNSGQNTVNTTVKIETLLEECVRRNASDLHLQYGLPPILRVDGMLTPVAGTPALNEEMLKNLIFATLDDDQQKILSKTKSSTILSLLVILLVFVLTLSTNVASWPLLSV